MVKKSTEIEIMKNDRTQMKNFVEKHIFKDDAWIELSSKKFITVIYIYEILKNLLTKDW